MPAFALLSAEASVASDSGTRRPSIRALPHFFNDTPERSSVPMTDWTLSSVPNAPASGPNQAIRAAVL